MNECKWRAMKTIKELETEIIAKFGNVICCNVPDDEFRLGGMIGEFACRCGHHHGWGTCCNLGYANSLVRQYLEALK